ncbi:hypothetical protein ACS0TY_006115 [Phlomoides rotata]
MFNKNNAYDLHLPQGSLSHHHFHTGGDEILFHHHHQHDILSGHYFGAPAMDAAAFYNLQDTNALDPSSMVNTCPKTTKKDRHSKIYTSQGPRDRRVRLSIGVARRFFDLQEILGFDKPSKTLDWLLTNSKTAIQDLMQTKENENGAVSSSPSECDADSAEAFELGLSSDSKRKLVEIMTGGGDRNCSAPAGKQDLVKESRVKARARARERTREKMCIKQLHDDFNSSCIPIQHMNNQLDQFCRISGNHSSDTIFHSHPAAAYEAANDQDLIQQDSILIKRKLKNFISNSSNVVYAAPSPNYTENWDICAILDSQKFNR